MIFLRYRDFDLSVKGFTVLDEDGNYNIYINSRYSYDCRVATLAHEMDHIKNGDFDKVGIPAHLIERTSA